MSANDGGFLAGAVWYFEPRQIAGWDILHQPLVGEIHFSIGRAYTHARHGVDYHTQALVTLKSRIPPVWLIAIHMQAKPVEVLAAQRALDDFRECRGFFDGPGGQ